MNLSAQYDIYTTDEFVECQPVLREKWIIGIVATVDNVEERLDNMWEIKSCNDETNDTTHDNLGFECEDLWWTDEPKFDCKISFCPQERLFGAFN